MTPAVVTISAAEARALALESQGLTGSADRSAFGAGKAGALKAFARLGYVQIDTIAVVERAHHHVLWSRLPDYRPALLDELHGQDARIFEYWSHAASYLPIEDYRFSLSRMRAYADGRRHWFRHNKKMTGMVLDRIRAEGPLAVSDFEAPAGKRSGPWFEWKPAKIALERLFHEGSLMVARRRGFQKIFDLPERVLPSGTDTSVPTPDELGRHLVARALEAHGLMTEREIAHLRSRERASIRHGVVSLREEGVIVPVRLEGAEGRPEDFYVFEKALDRVKPLATGEGSPVRLLSPFDNAVIRRPRLKRLFGFDYQIECYVPEPKRKFGYFCLPVLWGDRFVGRVDAKADRATKRLLVKSLHFEPGFREKGKIRPALREALESFARFNGCDEVKP